jgi:tRNA A-37 threonylcarbamoyl transferase component Bud32
MAEEFVGQNIGRYQIERFIARGAMGSVYLALQPTMHRRVAVKVLPRELSSHPKFQQRFAQETRVISQLEHPHILPVYDSGQFEGRPYIVMRYLDGGTVYDKMQAGPMQADRALGVVKQMASALDYAHERGVIHRDLKPSNVLLDREGNAYLTDFGIAKLVSEAAGTLTKGMAGTPAYMSPEQVQADPVSPQTDIYSLGVMVFEMLAGHLPFQAESPIALAMLHVSKPPPSLLTIRPDLPPGVDAVIQQALAKDPAYRPASAGAFAHDLAAGLEGLPTSAETSLPRPAPIAAPTRAASRTEAMRAEQPAAAPARPRSALPIVAGVGLIVVIAVVVGVLAALSLLPLGGGEEPPPPTLPFQVDATVQAEIGPRRDLLTDTFDDPSSGFPTVNGETGSVRYEGGALLVEAVGDRVEWFAPSSRLNQSDVVIDVDAIHRSGTLNNEFGPLCRWLDSGNHYQFAVSSDGHYAIWKRVNGQFTMLVDWTSSGAIETGEGSSNHIRAECVGPTLTLYVNGAQAASVEDADLGSGDVALMAGLLEAGEVSVSFDNLIVKRP